MKRLLDWRLLTALLVFVFGMTLESSCKCNYNKPDEGVAVDLGLPSGTLWADRNIGADSPKDYGYKFAWGETKPKKTYDWSNYKWCNGSSDKLTKYCPDADWGTIDNKMTLELEDDAATSNWGENWRMPTCEEMEELEKFCSWVWFSQNGVKGCKVVGPNGNSIFLPANELGNGQTFGAYWSSSILEDYPVDDSGADDAWYIETSSIGCNFYWIDRCNGLAVRAVVR